MNDKIKELAEKAGFVLWGTESWNPGDTVDWSCRYDDELIKYTELIVKECANRATWAQDTSEKDIGGEVLKHFGVTE